MSKRNHNKDAVIARLKREKTELEAQVDELKYILHDIQVTNCLMREQVQDMHGLIEQDIARECGCVVLSNTSNYQDFVGILLNNGYVAEAEPIHKGQLLRITIKESEV